MMKILLSYTYEDLKKQRKDFNDEINREIKEMCDSEKINYLSQLMVIFDLLIEENGDKVVNNFTSRLLKGLVYLVSFLAGWIFKNIFVDLKQNQGLLSYLLECLDSLMIVFGIMMFVYLLIKLIQYALSNSYLKNVQVFKLKREILKLKLDEITKD